MASIDRSLNEILTKAEEIADDNKNNYIGLEHLLKAISCFQTNRLAEVLSSVSSSSLEKFRDSLEAAIPRGKVEDFKSEGKIRTTAVNQILKNLKEKDPVIQSILEYLTEEKNPFFFYLLMASGTDAEKFKKYLQDTDTGFVIEAADYRADTPNLNQIVRRELTILAKQGKLDPVIGRKNEIKRISETLIRYKNNNPLLIGNPGTGKTSIVDGFAQYLLSDECPKELKSCILVEISVLDILDNTGILGQLQTKMKMTLNELRKNPNIILFMDELHMIMGAGAVKDDSANTLANMLKPALACGDIKMIGATTIKEYRKYIEKDRAFSERFQIIDIKEPSTQECTQMLREWNDKIFSRHYNISIDDKIFQELPELCKTCLPLSSLPRSAVNLLDEALAEAKLKNRTNLHLDDVRKRMAVLTDMDLVDVNADINEKLTALEKNLNLQLIGQKNAIRTIVDTLQRAYSGIDDSSRRPVSVCLLYGPSGVGKTFFCRLLAKNLFGNDRKLLIINMQDYSSASSISNLTGSAKGLIGSEDGGILTNHIRQNPYSIILLDEIEKACREIRQFFLSLFDDDAHLTDPQTGEKISAQNIIFIMTSNLKGNERIGFDRSVSDSAKAADFFKTQNEGIMQSMKKSEFSEEFINRISSFVLFSALSKNDLAFIAKNKISEYRDSLKKKGISLKLSDSVYDQLADQAVSSQSGARLLNRIIDQTILFPISRMIIQKTASEGSVICIEAENTVFHITERKSEGDSHGYTGIS